MNLFSVLKFAFWSILWPCAVCWFVAYGLQCARGRVVSVKRLLVVPSIMFVVRIVRITSLTSFHWAMWLVGLVGCFVIYSTRRVELIEDQVMQIQPDYSVLPLLLFFTALKTFGGFYPAFAAQYAMLDGALINLFGGYWMGQAAAYVRKYLQLSRGRVG